jgi:hypothetical protein
MILRTYYGGRHNAEPNTLRSDTHVRIATHRSADVPLARPIRRRPRAQFWHAVYARSAETREVGAGEERVGAGA